MKECYQTWAQLEREAGTQLHRQTELLLLGTKENPGLKTIQATLSRQGIDHEYLSSVDLKQRFPNIRFTRGEVGLLDKTGGVLYADKALRALQVRLYSPGAMQLLFLGMLAPSQAAPGPCQYKGLCFL